MRTIHLGLRVADADRSIAFYTRRRLRDRRSCPGYADWRPDLAQAPGRPVRHDRARPRPGPRRAREDGALSHLVIATESMNDTIAELTARGIDVDTPTSPDGSDNFLTTVIVDPDGNRIEIVQWPPGHPAGFTEADFTT